MSNDLCSPYQCNICLMLQNYDEESNSNSPPPNKTFPRLLTCSGCQLIKYCTSEHQNIDWPIHKELCQAMQKIKKKSNLKHPLQVSGELCKREDMETAIVQLKYLLRNTLGRSLEFPEEELTSFPSHCPLCFQFRNLKACCSKCLSQSYCTEEHKQLHRDEHEKVCKLLQTYYCPYKVRIIKDEFGMQFHGKLKSLENMDLVKAFEETFALTLAKQPYQDLKKYQLFSHAADFSCIMTICYAIEQIKMNTQNIEKFKILVLGASIESVLWFTEIHCKLFFMLNPDVKELSIKFIGPELIETSAKEFQFSFKDLQRLVKFGFFKGLFQDYCQNNFKDMHLIVAFNCGFSEHSQTANTSISLTNLNALENFLKQDDIKAKDTWFPGLIEILQTFDTPIVFTSFTEQESHFDYAALKNAVQQQKLKVHIEHILKVTKNPFHDLRPLRQWYTRDKEEFYYRNGYIQAIRTHLEK